MYTLKIPCFKLKWSTFFIICGIICFILSCSFWVSAQVLPSFLLPVQPLVPFQTYFPSTFPLLSPYSTSLFLNPFLSPFTTTGLPALPATTNPVASALGLLVPPPPTPVATIAGTTITATTALTSVQVRLWLGGPPLTLSLPVPTTIYIVPSAAASGLLIQAPTAAPPIQLPFIPPFFIPFI